MNLSEPFIRRPVMTLLVMIGILTFGIVAYRQLPVAQLPDKWSMEALKSAGSAYVLPGRIELHLAN